MGTPWGQERACARELLPWPAKRAPELEEPSTWSWTSKSSPNKWQEGSIETDKIMDLISDMEEGLIGFQHILQSPDLTHEELKDSTIRLVVDQQNLIEEAIAAIDTAEQYPSDAVLRLMQEAKTFQESLDAVSDAHKVLKVRHDGLKHTLFQFAADTAAYTSLKTREKQQFDSSVEAFHEAALSADSHVAAIHLATAATRYVITTATLQAGTDLQSSILAEALQLAQNVASLGNEALTEVLPETNPRSVPDSADDDFFTHMAAAGAGLVGVPSKVHWQSLLPATAAAAASSSIATFAPAPLDIYSSSSRGDVTHVDEDTLALMMPDDAGNEGTGSHRLEHAYLLQQKARYTRRLAQLASQLAQEVTRLCNLADG